MMSLTLRYVAALAVAIALPLFAQTTSVSLASTAPSAIPARDSAIRRLQSFLAKYPNSELRPEALLQLGELLVLQSDERFAQSQRASGAAGDSTARSDAPVRPDYDAPIRVYEELIRRYTSFEKLPQAAYTLGTLYAQEGRYADAVRVFRMVTERDSASVSPLRPEAAFRLGDAYFEQAARARGPERRTLFARAAQAYEQATRIAPANSDIYFLALYKLGWSYYNQATQTNQDEYRRAVEVFGRLVESYDRLTPDQQARLGLRGEAIEYMAVAFTQVGGADAASQYFTGDRAASSVKLPILRRVAASLRDQGDFTRAIEAYRAVMAEAPNDSSNLAAQQEIIDMYQNRMIEPAQAQAARLELVERFAPGTPWASANPALAQQAAAARETALRQSGQYLLAQAQRTQNRAQFGEAAGLYQRYISEFANSDSARAVGLLYGEALFGQGEFMRAGAEYSRSAYGRGAAAPVAGDTANLAQRAGQNAIVAFDSALARNKTDRAAQDSLFAAVDNFVRTFPQTPQAKQALIQKGRRASETQRWDVMAETFRNYAATYPNDPYTPTAQKLVGDALFRSGQYAEAQTQWDAAATVARASGRTALADSITRTRENAAGSFADTLIKQGEYRRAAEDVYVAFADRDPQSARAPEALRDAISTYITADSVARQRNDEAASRQAKERQIELTNRLVTQYPTYRFRRDFQSRLPRLYADLGRNEESVDALRKLVADNPTWAGRADAMVQIATVLDTVLNRKSDAAAAYAAFAQAFPRDRRAADAQYNAAVTYLQAGDSAAASRAFGEYASRFPTGTRAQDARSQRAALLRAVGDTAAARREFQQMCARPTGAAVGECKSYRAEQSLRQAYALIDNYQAIKLRFARAQQLTKAGIPVVTRPKLNSLASLVSALRAVINTGVPEYLAAATYYLGHAQWELGNYYKNVELPATLDEQERTAAMGGFNGYAETEYKNARATWQALIDRAAQEPLIGNDPGAQRWLQAARDAIGGNVPETPPPPADGAEENQ
jgi:TolA-binding protein